MESQETAVAAAAKTGKQDNLPFPRDVETKAPETLEPETLEPPPAGSLMSIDFRRLSEGERNQILSLKANKQPPQGAGSSPTEGQPLLPFPMEVRLGQAAGVEAGDSKQLAPALPNWRNLKKSRGKEAEASGPAESSAVSSIVTDHTGAECTAAPVPELTVPEPATPEAAEMPAPPVAAAAPVAAPAPATAAADDEAQAIAPAAATQSTVEPKRPRLGPGAIAALVLLAGLGLWALLPSNEPAEETSQAEPAAVTPVVEPVPAPAETTAAPEAAAQGAVAPIETADTAAKPAVPDEEPAPSFDLIRVEPNGEAVLAGRAAPHADLIILNNDVPLGTVKADGAGEWAFIPAQPLLPGDNAFSLVVSTPQGEVVLPARKAEPAPEAPATETPSSQSSDDAPAAPASAPEGEAPQAAPEGPQTGDGVDAAPPLPVAKPPHSALPGIMHYGVQLSSTRSEQAALQEWQLLRQRFPTLLGDKDLLIQKADLQDGGTRFRVRTTLIKGPQAARKLCEALRAQNQDCLVFRE